MKTKVLAIVAGLILVLGAAVPALATATEQAAKDVVHTYIDAFNAHDPEAFGATVGEDVHSYGVFGSEAAPSEGEELVVGRDNYVEFVSGFWAGFPDISFSVEEMIAEGDRVAVRWTVTGTYDGEPTLPSIAPEGQEIEIIDYAHFRIEDGQVAEKWYGMDVFTFLQQLGAIEEDEEASSNP